MGGRGRMERAEEEQNERANPKDREFCSSFKEQHFQPHCFPPSPPRSIILEAWVFLVDLQPYVASTATHALHYLMQVGRH